MVDPDLLSPKQPRTSKKDGWKNNNFSFWDGMFLGAKLRCAYIET